MSGGIRTDEPSEISELTVGQCATWACLLEVTAPKPGNVHRGADFQDMAFGDFLASAMAIAPAMDAAPPRKLGDTILSAIRATRNVVATNTNLGTVLLLAPMASVPRQNDIRQGVANFLEHCSAQDARQVYAAIRLAEPGGLGRVTQYDIASDVPDDLLTAMSAAAEHDLVARQYVNGFCEVLDVSVAGMVQEWELCGSLTQAIIHTHLRLMSEFPDSLIARKCGDKIAQESARHATSVLKKIQLKDEFWNAVADFDFWLRADGNRRNPGTTADLIAAGLFVALRDQLITPPFR